MNETDPNPPAYRMPAEWEPQSAVWLSWPHNIETWPENLAEAQAEFAALVRTVAKFQPANVLVSESHRARSAASIGDQDNVTFVDIPTNDAWVRDYGPTFVHDRKGNLVVVDWHYNAWGGKYPPFDLDQQVAVRIAEHLGVKHVSVDLCLEGGAIEVNQTGLLLSTLSCAMNLNRNPGKPKPEIEKLLRSSLGVRHCVWLTGDALCGDDTDGHIDQLARFTDDRTIVYAMSEDRSDPQCVGLDKNLVDLQSGLMDAGCDDVRLVPLAIPDPIVFLGQRIPASYCNFLVANGLVVVPQFGVRQDSVALETLQELFPKRTVVGLDSIHLSYGQGSFHCLSQQQPANGTSLD